MLTQERNGKNILFAMGEALIDFVPGEAGKPIKEVESFLPAVGGAPCNVCGAFAKLGGQTAMITQLGEDYFGDKIIAELQQNNVDCNYVRRTKEANTSLTFVALAEDGKREFSFFRNPGADMLYQKEYLQKEWFSMGYAFHFCSVSLGNFPMKEAHLRAIQFAKEAGMLVSFDPNLRPALWQSKEEMAYAVREFMGYADLLKISDEELELITGQVKIEDAVEKLFSQGIKMVVYTKGGEGAEVYTRCAKAKVPGIRVKAVDTTGAGDGFIGAFLYQLWKNGVTKETLAEQQVEKLEEYLTFANQFCSICVQEKGAIRSYPTLEKMKRNIKQPENH